MGFRKWLGLKVQGKAVRLTESPARPLLSETPGAAVGAPLR